MGFCVVSTGLSPVSDGANSYSSTVSVRLSVLLFNCLYATPARLLSQRFSDNRKRLSKLCERVYHLAVIKSIRPVLEPTEGLCIEVDSEDRLFAAGGENGAGVVSHNSVAQRNVLVAAIGRPDFWRVLCIDLKRVELSSYRKYSNVVLGVATELEDALTVLRFAQQTMMKRYNEMEQLGYENFLKMPNPGKALLVMVDEAGELLSPAGVKALGENTPVLTDKGLVPIGQLNVGDTVIDPNFAPCTVERKYIPQRQAKYNFTCSRDDGVSESFIAGSEHNWPVYLFSVSTGEQVGGELKLTTEQIMQLLEENAKRPASEQVEVRMRRAKPTEDELKKLV